MADPFLTPYTTGAPIDLDELERLLENHPGDPVLIDCLAFRYYTDGRLEDARAQFESLLDAFPNHANSHYYLGNIHYKQGRIEDAIRFWTRLVEVAPASQVAESARRRADRARRELAKDPPGDAGA